MKAVGSGLGWIKDAAERIVLVVEDEPILRTSMARGLSRLSNVDVVVASNLAEARKLLQALSPRVVLLDLHLPDGTGMELISDVERVKPPAALIFVTAYPQKLDKRTHRRGELVVLEKPVPIADLRRVVMEAFGDEGPPSSPFGLADFMQLAWLSRRTTRIDLRHNGDLVGSVWVQDGFGHHAVDGMGNGLDALRRLLLRQDVTAECHGTAPDPSGPRTLGASCEELLLDAARAMDESSLERDPLSALGDAKAPETEPPRSFEQYYAAGVDALLSRSYEQAYSAFSAAEKLGSTAGLTANLSRLRAMGYGQ